MDVIRPNSISNLLDIIVSSTEPRISWISKTFKETYTGFDLHLAFLIDLQIIAMDTSAKDDALKILFDLGENKMISLVQEKLIANIHKFPKIREYLELFEIDNRGDFVYASTTDNNLKYSQERNLLISFSLVNFDSDKKTYQISSKRLKPLLQQFLKRSSISKKALAKVLHNQKVIGDKAELAVLEYERKRLNEYPYLVSQIEHTSELDESAGYDLKSYEIDTEGIVQTIRIEVKATSEKYNDFYWSDGEIEQSQIEPNRYYLYLIPVVNGNPDNTKINIISNPFAAIHESKTWNRKCKKFYFWENCD